MRFVLGLAFGTVVIAACVGDTVGAGAGDPNDAGTSSGAPGASSGAPDASSSGAPSSSSSGSSGTPEGGVCPENFAECDNDLAELCETDLRSAQHCGSCGNACEGNATCIDGACGPDTLASLLDRPFSLEMNATRAIWYDREAVLSCRLADCANTAPIVLHLLENTNGFLPQFSPQQLAIVGENFYFGRCPSGSTNDCGIGRCSLTGCRDTGLAWLSTQQYDRRVALVTSGPGAIYSYSPGNALNLVRTSLADGSSNQPPINYRDYLQAVYVDSVDLVYVDDNPSQANPDGGLYRCPAAGCSGSRQRLLPPPVKQLTVHDRVAFVSSGPATSSSIVSCSLDDCAGTERVLSTQQSYVSAIAADQSAVYWASLGAQSIATNEEPLGTISRCALPNCAGGPTVIARGLLNPVSVRVSNDYVYWLTYGKASSPSGTFARLRR